MAALDPDIESRALNLPPGERARLAQRLLTSLDAETDADNEKPWLEEAERRLDALESKSVLGIPADQVFKDARTNLR